jgi:Mn2+/Fe2+ NRAMP family transporter
MSVPASLSDPYRLDRSQVAEPPTRLSGMLRYLGPGFILSASIVGSGELIATTLLGAKVGFLTFWVILVSCLVKVTLQIEFGKHAIHSGETTFETFNRLPGPKFGRASWATWLWFALMLLKFVQVGGIVGAVAIILQKVRPLGSGDGIWAVAVALVTSALVYRGYYRTIERASVVMIGLFTLFTLASVFMLQFTPYAVSWSELGSGLTFRLPSDHVLLLAVVGAFGITGVGGDEIMTYNYWLLEKGYAAKVGPREDTPDWERRAKGWIRVMAWDAVLAMVVYTVVTAAFYLLGAAVLHQRALVDGVFDPSRLPDGSAIVDTLSAIYTETLGPWAKDVFLAGAIVVLYSTLFAALAGWTRLYSDCFGNLGWIRFHDLKERARAIAWLAWTIPLLWALGYMIMGTPGQMVLLGGVATSAILLVVVFAVLHTRYRQLPEALRPGRAYDWALWTSAVSIVAGAVYALATTLAPVLR